MKRRLLVCCFLTNFLLIEGCGGRSIVNQRDQPGNVKVLTNADGQVNGVETPDGIRLDYTLIGSRTPDQFRHYQVGSGDELEVLLERVDSRLPRDPYEVSSDFIEEFAGIIFNRYRCVVDPMGDINVPLSGVLRVSGRSTREIESELIDKIGEFLVSPRVVIRMVSYGSYVVNVLGKVERPGRHELKRPITLSEAVVLGGGVTREGTLKKVFLIRRGGPARKFNIMEIWNSGNPEADVVLERDDIVYVPHKTWITWETAQQIAIVVLSLTSAYFQWAE